MRLKGLAVIAACVVLLLIFAGCGDTFRPVVTPQTGGSPLPQVRTFAMVLSAEVPVSGSCSNGSAAPCPGAATQIDVSGDVNLNDLYLGAQLDPSATGFVTPVKMAFIGQEIFVLTPPDSSLSAYYPTIATTFVNLALPAASNPVAPAVANYTVPGSSTSINKLYVAGYASNQAFVVTAVNSLQTALTVGTRPISITISLDNTKAYVVNSGSNNVTVISTGDETVNPVTGANIPVGNGPRFAVTNKASGLIYVLNSDSSITTIDPVTDTPLATTTIPKSSPSGATAMAYDAGLNRLYVANKNTNNVTVYDANPRNLAELSNSPVAVGAAPTSVAVLPDGTKAYVVNSGENTGCSPYNTANLGRVSVITGSSNTVTACVTVGQNPVWAAASTENSKVYVVHQGKSVLNASATPPESAATSYAPGTTIIRSSTNLVITDLAVPAANHEACVADATRAVCKYMLPFYVITSN